MSYKLRVSLFIIIDTCIILSAIFFSSFLVNATLDVFTKPVIITGISLLICHHAIAFLFNLYKKVWEYASTREILTIFKVVTSSILVAAVIQEIVYKEIYFRLLLITWLLHLLLICGSRLCGKIIFGSSHIKRRDSRRTLIIGAGSAGVMVARQLMKSKETDLTPVGFIDDDLKKQGLQIMGISVLGRVSQIKSIATKLKVDNIVIAIPSLNKKQLNKIFQECAKTHVKTQILPMLEDLVSGKVSVNHFRDVQVEDLLGREPIKLNMESISEYLTGKCVLVTGAGGSIGSEICRQVAEFKPAKLILLGHGENSIYSIEIELKESFPSSGIEFITEIADIQDKSKIELVIMSYRPDVIYHAAAHKHVPLMERNPEEAVKNNVIGTINIANAASNYGVGTFVLISTDKAVNPTSVMGSAKRLAEMIIQDINKKSNTKFVAVRFGNVLGSRGSVIPLFKRQIENGGPVTVTHKDMERYFMTIPEASRLVIQAGALAKGGEIFVLDMGDPVKIIDLAKNMIKLSGNSIEDIGIEYTGIRPGEKLFEELLKEDEVLEHQIYPKIYVGKTSELLVEEIDNLLTTFTMMEKAELREKLLMIANNRVYSNSELTISM